MAADSVFGRLPHNYSSNHFDARQCVRCDVCVIHSSFSSSSHRLYAAVHGCLPDSLSHTLSHHRFFFFVHFSPFSFRFAYGMTLRYCHSSCCSSWNITCRCSLLIYVFIFSDPGSVRHIMWIYQSWPILGPRNAVDPSSNASHVGYAQLNCIFVTFFFLWLTKWFRRFYWI